jgi:tripartite-type tricarboxylate transporter receptor subunit TctC
MLLALAMGIPSLHPASAQDFPNRPIKLLVPYAAGGATDSIARILAHKLQDILGQSVVVLNKAGANGQIGLSEVARADPDGYTLLLATLTTHAISPAGSHKLPYDIQADFVHIGLIASSPMLLIVPSKSPITSLKSLIAQAKVETLSYASYGIGSAAHLAAEMLSQAAGIKMVHVPYKGTAPASQALLAGEVSLYFDSGPSGLPLAKANRVKALAITSPQRNPEFSDIPTVSESIPGFEVMLWWGLSAPRGVDPSIVQKLNGALAATLTDSSVKERLAALGADVRVSTSGEFTSYIGQELKKWREVMRKGNISLD